MSLPGYIPKHKPALWRTTPSGRRQAAHEAERAAQRRLTRQKAASARRKPVRRVSTTKAKASRIYNIRVKAWLKEIGHTFCHCCIARNEAIRPKPATQCHHRNGRLGSLLMDESKWIPVCADCHDWIHNREPELAREIGMLCPKGMWNQTGK